MPGKVSKITESSKKSKKEESTDDSTYSSESDNSDDSLSATTISSSDDENHKKFKKNCSPQIIEYENLTMFSSDEICVFVVNDYSFSVHKHILRKMHIFDALLDGDISNQELFQISYPNIKQIYVVKIISCLYSENYAMFPSELPLIDRIMIECFMKYLAIDKIIINKVMNKLYQGNKMTIAEYIEEVKLLPICDEIINGMNRCKFNKCNIKDVIGNMNGLSEVFKNAVIVKFIKKRTNLKRPECDLIMGVNFPCSNEIIDCMRYGKGSMVLSHPSCRTYPRLISYIFKKNGLDFNGTVCLNQEKNEFIWKKNNGITVNIPFIGQITPHNKGVIGVNIYDTLIAMIKTSLMES